jgi:hypothetical protein
LSPPRPFFVTLALPCRPFFAALALLVTACGAEAPPAHPAIPANAATVRCISADARSWTLALDPARKLADGQPASFGPRRVDWRNASDGGAYELDLATGALTVTRASSTGGYQVAFACRPAAPAR